MTVALREVIEDAQGIIGEVAGPGAQTYSEDRMRKDAIRAFDLLFKKYHWRQYCDWFRLELDGSLGLPTDATLAQVRDFEDFVSVRRDAESASLALLPFGKNPYALTSAGSRALWWNTLPVTHADYLTKRLRFYPVTAVGFVNVHARIYPRETGQLWADDDIMHLDRNMLAYGTAFMTMSSDDLNPGGADVVKNLMEMSFRDIIAGLSIHDISSSGSAVPTEWRQV